MYSVFRDRGLSGEKLTFRNKQMDKKVEFSHDMILTPLNPVFGKFIFFFIFVFCLFVCLLKKTFLDFVYQLLRI